MQYFGVTDPDYIGESFGEQPLSFILTLLNHLERFERQKINAHCITNAIGFSGIFNGFAGKDGGKTQPKDLLPFAPDDEERNKPVMSAETTRIVLETIEKRQLAQQVISAIILVNPEIQQLMQR